MLPRQTKTRYLNFVTSTLGMAGTRDFDFVNNAGTSRAATIYRMSLCHDIK